MEVVSYNKQFTGIFLVATVNQMLKDGTLPQKLTTENYKEFIPIIEDYAYKRFCEMNNFSEQSDLIKAKNIVKSRTGGLVRYLVFRGRI